MKSLSLTDTMHNQLSFQLASVYSYDFFTLLQTRSEVLSGKRQFHFLPVWTPHKHDPQMRLEPIEKSLT